MPLPPDVEWNKTAAVARVLVQFGGLSVAIDEAAYTPQPPGGLRSTRRLNAV